MYDIPQKYIKQMFLKEKNIEKKFFLKNINRLF